MRRNIDETGGIVFAEKAMAVLAGKIGREKAHQLLEAAVRKVVSEKSTLADVLGKMPEIAQILDQATLRQLAVAEDYLGSTESFRIQLLRAAPSTPTKS